MDGLVRLPGPKFNGDISVEAAIFRRRSVRRFLKEEISKEALSQILWSAQGVLPAEHRTVPSAGGLFPLDIWVVIGADGLEAIGSGIYLYVPAENGLISRCRGDFRAALAAAAFGQQSIAEAPVSLIITADYERTKARYRQRAERYVHMEAGHAAQNVYLQATALGLGALAVGAFDDDAVREISGAGGNHTPLYIIPIGSTPLNLPVVF
jgi:SagB-type dehydrogenase family enzyme